MYKRQALEVFDKDCLIRLGTCIAPVGSVESKKDVLKAELEFSGGEKKEINLDGGDLVLVEADYQEISITLTPAKGIDVGAGVNETIKSYGFSENEVKSIASSGTMNISKWTTSLNKTLHNNLGHTQYFLNLKQYELLPK